MSHEKDRKYSRVKIEVETNVKEEYEDLWKVKIGVQYQVLSYNFLGGGVGTGSLPIRCTDNYQMLLIVALKVDEWQIRHLSSVLVMNLQAMVFLSICVYCII